MHLKIVVLLLLLAAGVCGVRLGWFSALKPIVGSTVGWGMLFCGAAMISPAFPWDFSFGFPIVDPFRSLNTLPAGTAFSAYGDWHGAAISVAGGLGFLFLLATSPLRPIPLWRTLGLGVVGTTIFVFIFIYSNHHWRHFPVREFGGLLGIASAGGILLVTCIEVRQLLARRVAAQAGSPEIPRA